MPVFALSIVAATIVATPASAETGAAPMGGETRQRAVWIDDTAVELPGDGGALQAETLAVSPEYAAQAEAQGLSDRIHQSVQDAGYEGFLGTAVAPGALTLHWKGDLPAEIASLVETTDVAVEVRQASFSRAEAHQAIQDLIGDPPSADATVTRAGIAADFSGIEAYVDPTDYTTTASLDLPATASGIPVGWDAEEESEAAASRWYDEAPFSGGASIYYLYTEGGEEVASYCTTAFPVTLDDYGVDGILTAYHCGLASWRSPSTGALVGYSALRDSTLDSQALVGGASYTSETYVGSYLSSTTYEITGASDPAVNTLVYPQGSWSGGSEIRVTAVDQYISMDGSAIGPGFVTENEDGEPSVGFGDSGGPVITPVSGSSFTATARGVITAILSPLYSGDDCIGVTMDERMCSVYSFHVNIDAIEDGLSVTVG